MSQHVLDLAADLRTRLDDGFADEVVAGYFDDSARLARTTVTASDGGTRWTAGRAWDRVLTHRVWGFVVMGVMFVAVFWFTIAGAAVPSDLLYVLLVEKGHAWLSGAAAAAGSPWWLTGLMVDGVYLGTAWVVAVMLPPMAIFFPLFTLLEDLGYLPRVAFNMDRLFARAGAHGKQSLTMLVGFGCNAAGVTSTRIIDSPRERLIATLTNNFSVCNGRWPTLILMGTIFVGALAPAPLAGMVAAASVVLVSVLGIVVTLLVSWVLSRTALRGEASVYSLELPPYRRPQVLHVVVTSLVDRTLKVLRRAVVMAAPAGAVMWLIGNVHLGDASIATHLVAALDPVGWLLGLNGIILLAYLVAIPANEIVVPAILMLTLTVGAAAEGARPGVMLELGAAQTGDVLVDLGGWTLLTGVNLMLFSLLHNPCSTTMLTIWRETGSATWTVVATLLPLGLAFAVTGAVATVVRML